MKDTIIIIIVILLAIFYILKVRTYTNNIKLRNQLICLQIENHHLENKILKKKIEILKKKDKKSVLIKSVKK